MSRQPLPGASTALTMGIISLVGTIFCCGPFGAIFSIIGLSNAKSAERLHNENPDNYTGIENVKTGRILAYIGLAIAIIYLLFIILYFGVIIALISSGGFDSEF